MLSLLFIALAAILNSMMDTIENERFGKSIFYKLDERFWYKRVSWKYCMKFGSYPIDAWHLSKSLMIICFALAVAFAPGWWWGWTVISSGIVWNVIFNLFYNDIWTK